MNLTDKIYVKHLKEIVIMNHMTSQYTVVDHKFVAVTVKKDVAQLTVIGYAWLVFL